MCVITLLLWKSTIIKEHDQAIRWKTESHNTHSVRETTHTAIRHGPVQKGRRFSLHLNGVTTKMTSSQLQLIFHYCQIINNNVYDYGLNNTVQCMYPKVD